MRIGSKRGTGGHRSRLGGILLFFSVIALESPGCQEFFRPIGFEEAARMAVAASDELRNEYAQRAIRKGAWVLGRRAYLPRLSLTASEDDRVSEIGADTFLKNYAVNMDQLLWDGGRTSMNRRIEKAELNLQDRQLERMAEELAESAMASYRNVLSARAILEIRERARETLEEQQRILIREAELGLALPMDLVEAELAVSEARIEILSLGIDLAEAEQQLAELLGLERLPVLKERVDIKRSPLLPPPALARSLAEAQNPDLVVARSSITRRQAEAKYAALSWVPTVRLTGGFGLSGQRYPLTKHNWSVGLTIEFSSPWFSGTLGGSGGREPPYDRNARIQSTMSPVPEPAAAMTAKQARLALSLEQNNYLSAIERAGRLAENSVKKCRLLERKRALALESLELEGERYRLAELKLELGQLTRVELMEARLDYTQREISTVETAVALLEAERELERLLDLRPGELVFLSEPPGEQLKPRRNHEK